MISREKGKKSKKLRQKKKESNKLKRIKERKNVNKLVFRPAEILC